MRLMIIAFIGLPTLFGCFDVTNEVETEAINQEIKASLERSLIVTPPMTGNIDFSAESDFDIDVQVVEHQSYGTTLLVKEDCEFHGYHKDKSESVFLAKCGNKLANYKVQNSDWDITGFNVKSDIDMEVPLKLTGQAFNIDVEKVAESLANL